jgi:UDP-glucose 4-epimerase
MQILVVGGAGYIGSHVVRALLDAGHEVHVLDNMQGGSEKNLFPDAGFTRGDILDYGPLATVMQQGWDAVIHLAAFKAAGESMVKPEKYSVNNICGTINLLNAMSEAKVRRIIFSSSAAVYGEPQYLPVDEKHPTRPSNYYGFTKLEIERLLEWYDRLKGIRYAALRYFNAAGYDTQGRVRGLERNPANLLPVIMEVATGVRERFDIYGNDYDTPDGTGIRDYVHVSDLADAHIKAMDSITRKDQSLVVNLGSEKGISVQEMLDTARRITGEKIPSHISARRPGDPAQLVASSENARTQLQWAPKFSDVDTLVKSSWEIYRTT